MHVEADYGDITERTDGDGCGGYTGAGTGGTNRRGCALAQRTQLCAGGSGLVLQLSTSGSGRRCISRVRCVRFFICLCCCWSLLACGLLCSFHERYWCCSLRACLCYWYRWLRAWCWGCSACSLWSFGLRHLARGKLRAGGVTHAHIIAQVAEITAAVVSIVQLSQAMQQQAAIASSN